MHSNRVKEFSEAMKHLRFVIIIIATLAVCTTYLVRTSINVAIVYMVPNSNETEQENGSVEEKYLPLGSDIFPFIHKRKIHFRNEQENSTGGNETNGQGSGGNYFDQLAKKEFNYTRAQQEFLFSAFFIGYIWLQVLIGGWAKRYGPKWFLVVSLTGSAVFCFVTPFIAGIYWLFAVFRVIIGVFQSACIPSCFVLVLNWTPKTDRSFGIATFSSGVSIGTIMAFFASDYIVYYLNGWPSIFWTFAVSSFLCALIIAFFVTSYPDDHPYISSQELGVIKGEECAKCERNNLLDAHGSRAICCCNDNKNNNDNDCENEGEGTPLLPPKKLPVPWRKMFTNATFLVTTFIKINIGSVFMITYSQTVLYLKNVIHEDATENEFVNAMIQLGYAISLMASGYLSERIIERGYLNRTNTRRLFCLICGVGSTMGLCLIPTLSKQPKGLHIAMYLIGSTLGFSGGSDVPLPAEISKNFGPHIFALLNVISVIPGIILPNFVSIILSIFPNDPWTGWNVVFYIFAAFAAFSSALFAIFVNAERQPFDYPEGSHPSRRKSRSST